MNLPDLVSLSHFSYLGMRQPKLLDRHASLNVLHFLPDGRDLLNPILQHFIIDQQESGRLKEGHLDVLASNFDPEIVSLFVALLSIEYFAVDEDQVDGLVEGAGQTAIFVPADRVDPLD